MSIYNEACSLVSNLLDSPGKGGNVSYTSDSCMFIKSSGEDLKNKNHKVSMVDDFQYVNKPSMEYKMHKGLPGKIVIHYHPVYVLPYLCSNYQFEFGKVIDYYQPGDELAEATNGLTDNIIFLRNHGVVIQGDTIDEVSEYYNMIKDYFFNRKVEAFTPDDVVDSESDDLWLFRQYIKLTAKKEGLELNMLNESDINKLHNNENEKYRKGKM